MGIIRVWNAGSGDAMSLRVVKSTLCLIGKIFQAILSLRNTAHKSSGISESDLESKILTTRWVVVIYGNNNSNLCFSYLVFLHTEECKQQCFVHGCCQVSLARSAPSKGDGQGEGLLFTSYDRTLVVKQITSEDVADVHNILSEYHQVTTVQMYWLRNSRCSDQRRYLIFIFCPTFLKYENSYLFVCLI